MSKIETAGAFFYGEQGAISTIGDVIVAVVPAQKKRAVFNIFGTAPGFDGVFEASIDGQNWFPVIPFGLGIATADGGVFGAVTNLPSILSAGRTGFMMDCDLYWSVRFRCTAITSGSKTIQIGFGKS